MKKVFKYTVYVAAAILIICVVIVSMTYIFLNSKLDISSPVFVNIPKSTPFEKVLSQLNIKNLLSPKILLNNYTRLYYKLHNKKFYAGVYRFDPGMTNKEVIETIFSGQAKNMVKVTFPEGISVTDFAEICFEKLGTSKQDFIRLAYADSIKKLYNINAVSIEGYLMPETYQFYRGESAHDIIIKLLEESQTLWNKRFAEYAQSQGKSRHYIMTLASMIEAESPVREERRIVSAVFYNRLNRNMKLESDPTVQYAINSKKRLSYQDLESNNLYNTYKFQGLPPGPINSPSESSIEAALNPDSNGYLFFVAVGDGSGRHNFSSTFSQHRQYVKAYRNNSK